VTGMLFAVFQQTVGSEVERLVDVRDGYLPLQDFAYHVELVRAYWEGVIPTIYTLDAQTKVLSERIGEPFQYAMPVGMSPTALVLLIPFTVVSRWGMSYAVGVWLAFSWAMLGIAVGWGWWLLREHAGRQRLWFATAMVASVSAVALNATRLGQTSIVALAFLLLVVSELLAADRSKRAPRAAIVVIALAVLSLKAPYFIIGAALLINHAQWRPLGYAVGVLAVVVLSLMAFAEPSLLSSFAGQLTVYTGRELPAAYQSVVVRETQFSLFGVALATNAPLFVLRLIPIVGLGAIVVLMALALRGRTVGEGERRRSAMSQGTMVVGVVGALLLLSPYSGRYEDLLLSLPLFVLVAQGPRGKSGAFLGALALLLVLLNIDVILPGMSPAGGVLLKLGVLFAALRAAGVSFRMGAAEPETS
ncbi:MAG: DUF2029 domain-containing protein, partial [Bdellovibrionales bacterium]|nr:DUF2029 domain-containing protein [Bdellovibrionales bacterium]